MAFDPSDALQGVPHPCWRAIPTIPKPVHDEQLPRGGIIADDAVAVLQPIKNIRNLVPLQAGHSRNGLDADLVTAAQVSMRIRHAVEVDIPFLRRKFVHHLWACPKTGIDAANSPHFLIAPTQ